MLIHHLPVGIAVSFLSFIIITLASCLSVLWQQYKQLPRITHQLEPQLGFRAHRVSVQNALTSPEHGLVAMHPADMDHVIRQEKFVAALRIRYISLFENPDTPLSDIHGFQTDYEEANVTSAIDKAHALAHIKQPFAQACLGESLQAVMAAWYKVCGQTLSEDFKGSPNLVKRTVLSATVLAKVLHEKAHIIQHAPCDFFVKALFEGFKEATENNRDVLSHKQAENIVNDCLAHYDDGLSPTKMSS